jgi:uncharacterized protein (TIGR03083 family)
MTPEEFQAALRRESAAFVLATAGAEPDTPVPSCPGWTRSDLVHHLAGVFAFFRGTLEGAMDGRSGPIPDLEQALPPAAEFTVAQYEHEAEQLFDRLAEADPGLPMWNWSGFDQAAGWLSRRMAQETAVHRVDADLTAGVERPEIDPVLAADGVLEIGEIFLASTANYFTDERRAQIQLGGSLVLRPTDVPEGAVRFVADGPAGVFGGWPAGPDDEADCVLAGTASDLLLFLWNRLDASDAGRFTVSGDASVLTRWRDLPIFD